MKERGSAARVQDMTEGSSLRLILMFTVPLLIGNIFQQIYTMVDTMVVGHHLGDGAIAAIGATASLYSLIVNIAGGLNNGYGIIIAHRFGSGRMREMKRAVAGMMILDGAAALVLTALALTFLRPLMRFMNTPVSIFEDAYLYIAVICAGMVGTIAYNMFAAIFRAMGNSRTPLYFLIIACLMNIVLDILFVMVLEIGIAGAALATILSQTVSAVLCGIYALRHYRDYLPGREDFLACTPELGGLLSMGASVALMGSLVDLGSVTFQRANNVLGETIIAAYAASRKILGIAMQPQGTLALAVSTFIGQNWGAGKFDRIRKALKQGFLMEVAWSVFAVVSITAVGAQLVALTTGTTDPLVIEKAVLSLRLHFTTFPVLGILFCIRASMQAMGWKVAPVLSSCIELFMKILSAAVLIPQLGYVGTCITEPISWVLMTAYLLIVYAAKYKEKTAIFTGNA